MLTLNQIVSQITNLATAHNQIAESGVGDFAEWQAKERSYPILWVFHESTAVSQMEIAFSIRLICADRVIVGEEGDDTQGHEQEVISDTLLVLLDFLAYFQQNHSQPYDVVTSATIDPFTERLNDRLAGNSVTIQIRQPFDWNKCQIPQTGASIPPTVDGLTLYNFCDPSVIARLTNEQVACLIAQYNEPCEDATITINSAPFASVVSGGSLNVPVIQNGNPVGSKVGSNWVIPPCADGDVTVNSVAFGNAPSGGSLNVPVKNSAGTLRGSKVGADWVVPDGSVPVTNTAATPITTIAVPSGDSVPYVIPNVAWTDSDGSAESTPYGDAIVCTPPTGGWVRPSAWIAIPNLTAADERFYGVVAVFENSYNQLAVTITSTAANINWGDGTNVNSNGSVQTKVYDYATLAGAVNVWPDGRNYKQVLVDITRVGPAITSMEWTSAATISPRGNNNFIDVIFSLPSVVTLRLSQNALSSARGMPLLERLRIRDTGTLTTVLFNGLTGLQAMELPTLKGNMPNDLFPDIQVIQLADLTINGNNALRMFSPSRIRKVGNIVGNSLTGATGSRNIFADCPVLEEVGTLTINAATSLQSVFGSTNGSPRLRKIGLITAPNVTNLDTAFINCYSLSEVTFSNCASVTSAGSTYLNCVSLTNCVMPNLTRGVVFSTTNMGNTGMSNFANSIGIASGVQNITVTGTPFGSLLAALDLTAVAIAAVITGKGYGIIN